jgi:hypothetical protein
MSIDIPTCFTYAYSAGTFADFTQAITSDAASTNIINLDAAGIRIAGGSKPPWLVCRVVTAEDGTLATSLEIALETDSDSGFATTRRQINIWNIPAARTQTAGNILINQPLPHLIYQQYLRLYFNAVTTAAALTVCAWLAAGPESAVSDFDLAGL